MGSSATLERIFENVGHTFCAVDIRFAAVRQESTWRNAFTIIRFAHQEPDVVAAYQTTLKDRYGLDRTDHLWVGGVVHPFLLWPQVLENLRSGSITADTVDIRLREPLKNTDKPSSLRRTTGTASRWPALELSFPGHEPSMLYDDEISREVATLGYRDAYDLIRLMSETGFDSRSSSALIISAPVFALILSTRIEPKSRKLHVSMKRHRAISDLRLSAVTRNSTGAPTRLTFPQPVAVTTTDQVEEAEAAIEVPELAPDDLVEFRLAHASLGEIDGVTWRVHELLPIAERNLLFAALTALCPPDKLEKLLGSPAAQEKKRLSLTASAAFELHVSWILGAMGLQQIVLGEYEYLVHPQSGVRRGSIDILALDASARALIIGACTINSAKQEDFTNLLNVRRILKDEVLAEAACTIIPIVFTGAKDQPRSSDFGDLGTVSVVDADLLAQTVRRLANGEAMRFSDFLIENQSVLSPR